MVGKLSFAQEMALVQLHRGWPFGIDSRTTRGLIVRGLVEHGFYNERFPIMPFLSEDGAPVAAELAAAQLARAGMQRMRGTRFGVISGGKAPAEPEHPLSSEHRVDAGVGHAPGSAARGGSGASFAVIAGGLAR